MWPEIVQFKFAIISSQTELEVVVRHASQIFVVELVNVDCFVHAPEGFAALPFSLNKLMHGLFWGMLVIWRAVCAHK
jgi:hypothetical protein